MCLLHKSFSTLLLSHHLQNRLNCIANLLFYAHVVLLLAFAPHGLMQTHVDVFFVIRQIVDSLGESKLRRVPSVKDSFLVC
ncbi:hypothetical protein HanXRQr2_Chr03g0114081 [Helianthus annuus]|uniref:Uncharacterized protein n=1 Tax=Helianthus annuus TaxID=4232 RepID=A0A251V7F6_HELAN|nr:hypothetical protein HanXRQr2_Chr03g0114081 [Helianthus annuus]KAJ0601111.1 hypothetical protein HanIR_Chr03g0124711 [Helianthus annuus]KAJ0943939.1 hypothetical protein HanPSC8_Chr03g0110501 [Helianthus annuus]